MKNIFKIIILSFLVISQLQAQTVILSEDNVLVNVTKKKPDLVFSIMQQTGIITLSAIGIIISGVILSEEIEKKHWFKRDFCLSAAGFLVSSAGFIGTCQKIYRKVQQYRQVNQLKTFEPVPSIDPID